MIQLHNVDCIDFIQTLPDASVDVICIDPPYLYLKNQKLERPFNERLFFSECARVLTDKGFIVMFGRGPSFYRWNTLLSDLIEYKNPIHPELKYGFKVYDDNGFVLNRDPFKEVFTFKEEIIWNKSKGSSPLMSLCRIHETASIFSKGKGAINKVKIPYIEAREADLSKMKQDVSKILSGLNNPESLRFFKEFLDGQRGDMHLNTRFTKHKVTTDIRQSGKREVNALATLQNGVTEKSIIPVPTVHYDTIHPTQKPVRLLERLLALVIPDKPRSEIVVADFFAGSMSCMEAVHNMGMNGIACEIDEEYFEAGKKRIDAILSKPKQSELF